MIHSIIAFSVKNKLIIVLMVLGLIFWGGYSLTQIPIGAVPDVTNNQVQIITTSRNLATEEVEKFITYPVELEMANLPGVQEVRSISKFGLSVVTVVFDDDMGTYLPRQLIAEKLKSASEQIPSNFGTPEMGPISTGLGEIYQYTLEVEPGFESKYSAMDLRTIQDWIVKRQLSGIPGVVEVNTWGGHLKQYEVSLDPEKLRSLSISTSEVLKALEMNNAITGGGYVEKNGESFFIRGDGLVKSLEELGEIVVKRNQGISVLVNDIATLQYGHANRFGAITGNGQGEKVMGQVMMLKGANSNDVINNVKERVASIQSSLPSGVKINPFLERSELIGRTTDTIAENLILGALIVIFVLVLLLGNFRSGLIVASVIPLSLLFGISMMNIFGLSANLMSLGAIDFGIIIDGAVIIVEFILFQFARNESPASTQELRDAITIESASKVMQPAIFGQIIILIVFIPILALSGIEGKMFTPMAMSFSFTLIGAMLLSLTYIPMLSALICGRNAKNKRRFMDRVSDKIMNALYGLYRPVLQKALLNRKLVLITAAALLMGSTYIFSRLGGEFVPTLDEGDYVVQPVLKTGTSLSKTIEIMTEIESILINDFPEVEQVVSRIGAAEVPTDPMSMEETDVIIRLRPKGEWVSAHSKEELANKMKASMSIIPGIDFEFTQPIEMRFNELITGVRSDIAIKVFGEDLDSLLSYGNRIKKLIANVEGAADITVEKTDNLPQITVDYDRRKLAQLGLNVSEINDLIQMAFGGRVLGSIYEGERRFDMVARFQQADRADLPDMQNLFVDLPDGGQIPLKEVANVTITEGPAKISREDTKRRIVIGINVRNRDIESIVVEIQGILGQNLQLPEGYTITYGGQFENLRNASKRLQVAVPVALALIFMMLYFAFSSFRKALLVYSAIPLSAIGGVAALWMRGLPFSISAGIGFIALFGIAVLNGLVLIEFFGSLKEEGYSNKLDIIMEGTKQRLRPVLLTATSAALGFLPMAISTSAGAEVQRPLATVVIGGLLTATLLTLIVLPVLYYLFGEKKSGSSLDSLNPKTIVAGMLVLGLTFPFRSEAQSTNPLSLEESIELALQNNHRLKGVEFQVAQSKAMQKASVDFGKTSLYYGYDENNIAENGYPLNVYGISQSIPFPTILSKQKSSAKQGVVVSQHYQELEKSKMARAVAHLFYQQQYLNAKLSVVRELDSLYDQALFGIETRFEKGDVGSLEMLNIRTYRSEIARSLQDLITEKNNTENQFSQLLSIEGNVSVVKVPFDRLVPTENFDLLTLETEGTKLQEAILNLQKSQLELEKNKWLPDIDLNYFIGTGINENAQNFNGYQIGISLPLFAQAQNGRSQAQNMNVKAQKELLQDYTLRTRSKHHQLREQIRNESSKLDYFEEEGISLANQLLSIASQKYQAGETSFSTYARSMEQALSLKTEYLDRLNIYNQLVIELKYLNIDL